MLVILPQYLIQEMFNVIRSPSKYDFAEIEQLLIQVQRNQQAFVSPESQKQSSIPTEPIALAEAKE